MNMMRRQTFSLACGAMVLASGCLSGCSGLRGDTPEPTINVKQAVKKIDSLLDGTFKAINPPLKWRDGPARMSEIKNSFTNTATGEVRVYRRRYVRTELSKARLTKLLTVIIEHWKKEGFNISSANSREPSISGKSSDGHAVGVSVGGFGDVEISAYIGALSDGLSGDIDGEEGDKFPKAPNGGPDYTPDLRDPYWST
ncbi:hypothetical protein ACFXPZ_44630 [Streptomyces sp. NPDC059101]|uniref:hypothetical protein n=1 Tax=Streptomyces sp. NPDC059101 TaxID=3346728 RepID=UPI0036CCDEC3